MAAMMVMLSQFLRRGDCFARLLDLRDNVAPAVFSG